MTNILNLDSVLTISVGENRRSTDWTPKSLTWGQFCARLRTPIRTAETAAEFAAMSRDEKANAKDVGGFVGGVIDGARRKSAHVSGRQLLALDADYGTLDLWASWELVGTGAGCMYTTHSHTPASPRLRILIPLSRTVTAEEYEPVARRVAEWLDIEAFDDTTYQAHRLMFWPSCPKDGEYIFREVDGPWLDPDEVLASYTDWHDMRNWPRSSRQDKVIRKQGEKQGDPLTKPGIIGAFNRAYRITDAIAAFLPGVYTPCGAGRWTYAAGSTFGGAVTYDGDTFLYSHHDSDPVSGRLCSAFDLVRLHLYREQDKALPSDTPPGDLPSTSEMRRLCANDDAVRAELAEGARRPEDVFRPQTGLRTFEGDTTEQGGAQAFVEQYGHSIRYNGSLGWLFWDGTRWQTGAEPEIYMLALQFADDLYGNAKVALMTADDKPEKARAQALMKQAVKLRTASGLKGMLTIARVIVNDSDVSVFDADPWALNTPDGIIDLRTGTTRPHDPDARCTKITTAGTGDAIGADRWAAFIDYIAGGDAAFGGYLQTLAGMAAVGAVYEEGLVISYGSGGNGKSTFFGALRRVLGDYATGINADVLTGKDGRVDQSYVAALRGVRLAVMGETEEGAHFGVAQMKRLTSRDTISARALYKDPIEFTPSHTLIMHTNHLPRMSSLDGGTRRRIAVAPFPATLPPEKVITNYEEVLCEECGQAILAWVVKGAKRFYEAGRKLEQPLVVQKATAAYINGEDWLQRYLDDCCDVGEGKHSPGGELYMAYRAWAERNGEYTRRNRDFAYALETAGFRKEVRKGIKMWMGLAISETKED